MWNWNRRVAGYALGVSGLLLTRWWLLQVSGLRFDQFLREISDYNQDHFIELATRNPQRFHGTIYKAANWIYVGNTKGFHRTRQGYSATAQSPKMVFVKPLTSDAQKHLGLWLQKRPLPPGAHAPPEAARIDYLDSQIVSADDYLIDRSCRTCLDHFIVSRKLISGSQCNFCTMSSFLFSGVCKILFISCVEKYQKEEEKCCHKNVWNSRRSKDVRPWSFRKVND